MEPEHILGAPSLVIPPGSIIIADWHRCPDSKEYFSKIFQRKKRKTFGLLEAPAMPPQIHVDIVRYKIFLSGKSGVGKTALAARLGGSDIPSVHYETTGIETTVMFWPVKLRENGRILFFKFVFWDCGENSLRRFDHLLPSCKEQADAILFLFSFTDHASFEDIPNQISRVSDQSDNVAKLIVGTKFDLFMHTDVTEREITSFQDTWGLPVFRVGGDVKGGLAEVAPLLNALSEHLWHQDCVTASSLPLTSQV